MRRFLISENLKYRHSFERKLVVIAPLFFILYAVIAKIYLPTGMQEAWQPLVSMVFNWWTSLFLPLGIALVTGLAMKRELKTGALRALCLHDVKRGQLWLAKNLLLAGYLLVSTVVLVVVVIVAGTVTAAGPLPLREIVLAGLVSWLASLGTIPLQLAVAYWLGLPAGMALGIVGLLAGVIAFAPSRLWFLCPWSYALRLMCPVTATRPNGVSLLSGDPLLNGQVIGPGILLSLLVFAVFTGLGARWFEKREVK